MCVVEEIKAMGASSVLYLYQAIFSTINIVLSALEKWIEFGRLRQ
jgi:hypothetical protein